MKREILYTMKMPYRQDFQLEGFRFGEGEKSCAVVGGIRGDEVQQMYTCARLVKALAEIEQRGNLLPGHEILVIPCANRFSMNVANVSGRWMAAILTECFPVTIWVKPRSA